MSTTYPKRGTTYSVALLITHDENGVESSDFTGATIEADLRTLSGTLVCDLAPVWVDASTGSALISVPAAVTALWPVRRLQYDVKFTLPSGFVDKSPTLFIDVDQDVTP